MYESYGKMITLRTEKVIQSQEEVKEYLMCRQWRRIRQTIKITLKRLWKNILRLIFEADNAVLPLFEGYKFTDTGSKTYSNEGTRDIKAMIDDVYDFTARAFQIPPCVTTWRYGEH